MNIFEPDGFRITLAVAGFSEMICRSRRRTAVVIVPAIPSRGRARFSAHGALPRAFQRSFVLADGVDVTNASLENGLLNVDLRRVQPQQVVQTIPISRK
ncbi:Hsp20 family protein [Paracoccus tegillarcae]|uniref:Hsp20 family protein n=1 Tax=Paracoccus tegillarcae TaxID=1529068 RepID=UPI0030D495CF